MLDGIVDEISQHLFELRACSNDHREFAFNPDRDVRRRTQDFQNAFEDGRYVSFTDSRVGTSDTRISQKIVEKPFHALDPACA
jgi:hypothetical protein